MYLKPSNIFYSQHQISATFGKWNRHRNTTIGETLDKLCNGNCRISDIETIKVVKKDGKWYTIDNRRLWVFHHLEAAGKCTEIPVEEVQYCSSSHSQKFSSKNGGTSVTIIKGRSPGGSWYKRLKPVTPIQKKEDKSINSESVTIVNARMHSEIFKTPSIVSTRRPSHDIINTVTQTSKAGFTAPCYATGVAAVDTKCKISASPYKTAASTSVMTVKDDIAAVHRHSFKRRLAHMWSGNPLLLQGGVGKSFRILDNFRYKLLNTKCYQTNRYKPYCYSCFGDNRHLIRHSRYAQLLGGLRGIKSSSKFIGFNEEHSESEESDSSDNDRWLDDDFDDWQDDDIAMFVDEREITEGNGDENNCSDDNNDSKEIDYDDDPWSDDASTDTSSEPEYDELDVCESDSDSHKAYHPFIDSESSDFEDDFLIAKELENIEKRERLSEALPIQNVKRSNDISNDKHPFTSVHCRRSSTNNKAEVNPASGITEDSEASVVPLTVNGKTSATYSILPGLFSNSSTFSISNDRTSFQALHYCTQSKIRDIIPSVHDTLPSKECASELAGLEHSASACEITDLHVSARYITKATPKRSTEPNNSIDSMRSSSFSETPETDLSCHFPTTTSISDSYYSFPVVSVAQTSLNMPPLDTIVTSVSTPVVAPKHSSSVKSESISSESSLDTDFSDTDEEEEEEEEDSEDNYYSLHYTFDDRLDKRRHAREIAIKKYGYDLFSSDSD